MPTPKKAATTKNALSKPVQPDAALATVVGKDPLPRTELTKKIWEYIRKHELQDPKDKRSIRADEKLVVNCINQSNNVSFAAGVPLPWSIRRVPHSDSNLPQKLRLLRSACGRW